MARIKCSPEETSLGNDSGYEVDGVVAMCSKCGHTIESFGTPEDSVLRCLAMLQEECPRGEKNSYVKNDEL